MSALPSATAFGVYGSYVWSAVGLFVLVTLVNALAARVAYRRARERAVRAHTVDQEPRSA